MSKITNCFLMLELLSNGRVYSVHELSQELGVTDRMVRYYKEQLELAGYVIESFKGPNGGYFINKKNQISLSYFNKYDLELLERLEDFVLKYGDGNLKDKYYRLNKKLHTIYNINNTISEYKELNITLHENDEKLNIVNESIINKNNLIIGYLGTDGKVTKRKIIPINLFEFENTVFLTAFCRLRGDIRHFDLSKIIDYKIN